MGNKRESGWNDFDNTAVDEHVARRIFPSSVQRMEVRISKTVKMTLDSFRYHLLFRHIAQTFVYGYVALLQRRFEDILHLFFLKC